MPNKPRAENPARPIRIEDGLWQGVQAIAEEDGTSSSEVVREAVRRYVRARQRQRQWPPGGAVIGGPRRLEWDEPAPADLHDHLHADDGEDAEPAPAGLAPTVGTRAPGAGKWHHPVGYEGTACGRRRVMSNWEVASLSDIPVGEVCSPCAKAMR